MMRITDPFDKWYTDWLAKPGLWEQLDMWEKMRCAFSAGRAAQPADGALREAAIINLATELATAVIKGIPQREIAFRLLDTIRRDDALRALAAQTAKGEK